MASCAKTAEPIKMPFGLWARMGPRNHVLDGDAAWRHLLNTIAPSMCGGDVAFCHTTLSTCLNLLYVVFLSTCRLSFTDFFGFLRMSGKSISNWHGVVFPMALGISSRSADCYSVTYRWKPGVNSHNTWCRGPASMVLQIWLLSGWGL